MTPSEVIRALGLEPLNIEGGYYRETYRSTLSVPKHALPQTYSSGHSFCYLLTPDTFSHLHRLTGDELFHFYLGDPVAMLQLFPDRSSTVLTLGQDITAGQHLQTVVPGGVWQGMTLAGGGEWALLGTTVSPGFEFEDYRHGNRDELIAMYPDHREMITKLTG